MANFFSFLKVPPHAKPIEDPEKVKKLYRHWRLRTMYSMVIGYAVYYFVRKNFSMAMPAFLEDLGYTKTDLGLILTLFSIIYGVGKFLNGAIADRACARYMFALGLLFSAVVNVFFGMSSGIIAFGVFWLLNAWFQSYGGPASVRFLTHWYSPTELGFKWGIYSTAHQIGGAAIMILCGYLIPTYGWRSAFYVPAFIAVICSLFLINRLRDTPQSVGLPPVEDYRGDAHIKDEYEDQAKSFKEIWKDHIFNCWPIWVLAIAHIFVYICRIGIMDWAPTFLVETRNSSLAVAGFQTAGFELAGIAGTLLAGWMSDKIFKGRRGPVAASCMFFLAASVAFFWLVPPIHAIVDSMILIAAGITVYAPQLLIPVAVADFATKKAASTAVGITGLTSYVIGSAAAGVITGMIADKWGWNGGFVFFMISALAGGLLLLLIWNKRAPQLEKHHNNCKSPTS